MSPIGLLAHLACINFVQEVALGLCTHISIKLDHFCMQVLILRERIIGFLILDAFGWIQSFQEGQRIFLYNLCQNILVIVRAPALVHVGNVFSVKHEFLEHLRIIKLDGSVQVSHVTHEAAIVLRLFGLAAFFDLILD